jgi:hypothetical protein
MLPSIYGVLIFGLRYLNGCGRIARRNALRRDRQMDKPHRVLHDSIVRAWGLIPCNRKETKMGAGQWARNLLVCEKCGLCERGGDGRYLGVILGLEGFVLSPVPKGEAPGAPVRWWSVCLPEIGASACFNRCPAESEESLKLGRSGWQELAAHSSR